MTNEPDMTPDVETAPAFLVGAERSGTTLLRLMLDCHPRIAWCSEFEFAVDHICDDGQFPSTTAYRELMSSDRIFLASGFQIDSNRNYPDVIRGFLSQKRKASGKPIVGATVHRHFDRLRTIWPAARFIHLVRDGRDVARSCIGMGWAGNVWTGAERWIEAEQLWERMQQSLTADQHFEVCYEQLIEAPDEVLTGICEFLGVPYDAAMLDYAKDSTYTTPDPRLTQQWRKKLSPDEIRLVESRIGPMLDQRGYELSDLPPKQVTGAERVRLRMQSRIYRTLFRLRRFGFGLLAADFLSRRLHVQAWQRRIRPRMNAIQEAHLK